MFAVHVKVLVDPDDSYEWQVRRFEKHNPGTPKPLRRQDEPKWPYA